MADAFLSKYADVIISELKLVTTTLSVIYAASHASLRRPSSAEPAKKKGPGTTKGVSDDDGDEEDNMPRIEGLQTSDAILFPVMAAIVLIGLYYLIQYLQDPAIINKVLQWYISVMSIASLVVFYSHGLQLVISSVFPRYWAVGTRVYRVCQATRQQLIWKDGQEAKDHKAVSTPMGPLPVASSTIRLPAWAKKYLWDCRELLTEKWSLEFKIHGLTDEKTQVRFHHGVAVLLSIATILSYHIRKSPFLTNLIGLAFCYSSGQYLSPNSFKTAFSILTGLFVYDIVMVFYTPYMVTVATTVDAPMKIIVETGAKTNILGLGDIAVPSMLIALALRFDLWMYYQAKVSHLPEASATRNEDDAESEESGHEVACTPNRRHVQIRTPYVDATGRWAEWLHTRSALLWHTKAVLPKDITAASFPKPYFYSSMAGYTIGLVLAMVMSTIFKHGQPALLYLVPGIIGALCLTALFRGETRYMMAYNEDGSLDHTCRSVELDERGRFVKFILEDEKKVGEEESGDGKKRTTDESKKRGTKGSIQKREMGTEKGEQIEEGSGKGGEEGDKSGKEKGKFQDVFLLRISAPRVEVNEEEVAGGN